LRYWDSGMVQYVEVGLGSGCGGCKRWGSHFWNSDISYILEVCWDCI